MYYVDAYGIYLSHFILLPLPAEPLIVVRISVCANKNRLPVSERPAPLPHVEHVHFWKDTLLITTGR